MSQYPLETGECSCYINSVIKQRAKYSKWKTKNELCKKKSEEIWTRIYEYMNNILKYHPGEMNLLWQHCQSKNFFFLNSYQQKLSLIVVVKENWQKLFIQIIQIFYMIYSLGNVKTAKVFDLTFDLTTPD